MHGRPYEGVAGSGGLNPGNDLPDLVKRHQPHDGGSFS